MNSLKNKKTRLTSLASKIIVLTALFMTTLFVLTPKTVSAGGSEDQTGLTVGALCYLDSGTNKYPIYITQPSDRDLCEQGIKGEIIDPGETVPAPVCVNNINTRGYDTDYSPEQCVADGGIAVNTGEELPKYYANDSNSAKNNQENLQDPGGITSKDRSELAKCDATDGKGNIVSSRATDCLEKNPIVRYSLWAINILSAGVGVLAVIMLIIGGIQYSSAGGDPQKVKAAKNRITNVVIGLVAYFFLFAFLQWIVPGGFF